ncbi:tail fiber assembly protein [Pseudomonas grimontii]|uniref:tail fiber assembly protein n=1 Tax=Pseudomonas grimontii TaxID=129847 RepID=UPI00387AB0A2
MSPVYFSPTTLGFYPADWKDDGTYTDANWPEDAILLTEEQSDPFFRQSPPPGKTIGVYNGLPSWVEIPVYLPTPEEMWASAMAKRDSLLSIAAIRIAPLEDAVEEDMATAADVALLKKWKQYRIAVNRIDQRPGFPANIDWPVVPI